MNDLWNDYETQISSFSYFDAVKGESKMNDYPKTRAAIQRLMETGVFPGYSVAFVEGETCTKFFAGRIADEKNAPVVKDHLFYDLASITKVFVTSTLLLQMLERNEIHLDTSIQNWFPDAKESKVTLRHLVTHTSGLWGYIPNRDQLTASELIAALLQLPATNTFHHTVHYTDTGFVLAGAILEKEFKKTVADLFQERIAQPLNLRASYGPLPKEQCIPTGYDTKKMKRLQGEVHDPKASVLGKHCGSAGLFATLDDCLTMVQLYLNGGKWRDFRFCREDSIRHLMMDWTPTKKAGRSLGWDIDRIGHEVWLRHTGFTGTTVVMNLLTKQAMVLLTNRIYNYEDTPTYNRLREEVIRCYEEEAYQRY